MGCFYRVNAITMLIAIVCLGENKQLMLETRLETMFDLMDFSNSGQITTDELVRSSAYDS